MILLRHGYKDDISNVLKRALLTLLILCSITVAVFGVSVNGASAKNRQTAAYNSYAETFNALTAEEREKFAMFAMAQYPGPLTADNEFVPVLTEQSFAEKLLSTPKGVWTVILVVLSAASLITTLIYRNNRDQKYPFAALPLSTGYGWGLLFAMFAGWIFFVPSLVIMAKTWVENTLAEKFSFSQYALARAERGMGPTVSHLNYMLEYFSQNGAFTKNNIVTEFEKIRGLPEVLHMDAISETLTIHLEITDTTTEGKTYNFGCFDIDIMGSFSECDISLSCVYSGVRINKTISSENLYDLGDKLNPPEWITDVKEKFHSGEFSNAIALTVGRLKNARHVKHIFRRQASLQDLTDSFRLSLAIKGSAAS